MPAAHRHVQATQAVCRFEHRRRGTSLVELGAVVAFLLPVLFIILYVCIEGCRFIAILQGLDQGARQAARNLATAYATDKGIVNDTQAQVTYGFAPVQVPGVINDPAQFDAPVWDNVPGAGNQAIDPSIPQSVTVFVTYKSAGSHTLPPFPDIDPLNLRPTLRLKQSATYIIEGGG